MAGTSALDQGLGLLGKLEQSLVIYVTHHRHQQSPLRVHSQANVYPSPHLDRILLKGGIEQRMFAKRPPQDIQK